MARKIILTASIFLALAVGIGAFGAHALKAQLSEEMLQVYKTGVEYHFYHALGLLLVGTLAVSKPVKLLNWSALFLTFGIILFSGSLYLLSVTGISSIGIITPVGGISFITGWILLFLASRKQMID
jgi:uncharacterized membrane protein YgdD (TMEM256/DUF423 family)